MNQSNFWARAFTLSLLATSFAAWPQFSYAEAPDPGVNETLQLAMHQGRPHGGDHERHGLHHGMGRGGKGICPQTRTAPQAPKTVYSLKNPLKPTEENLMKGESLYQWTAEPTACKVCHGPSGNGMGMMAQGLNAMPRNFTCAETMQEITDGQMFWIIKNGTPTGMPPYPFMDENEVWKVILYIRQMAK
ncbi:c-type cytochrome [Nitrospina gracilis]|uniref:c-type cytochrome n=1 Tax=Nitrospina gracilis TaxID=35801 RepID=UPI001F001FDD|nr:c-type cytochrome [Nitrospina gracilis]MCF8721468.1 mono/diheme cytochrome c family protein [Nitrospina gracilis Nb-211]